MSANLLQFTVTFDHVGTCGECGIEMVMPSCFAATRREDHKTFYCPNGHARWFPGKSEAEKLREELERKEKALAYARNREDALREVVEHTERRLYGTQGALAKVKKRVRNGVCPNCNRQFPDLLRHMNTKHPED